MTCIPCMIAFLGDFRYLPSGLRRINLKPIMRLDQLRRKICELIRMGCDEQSTDPKKNETTSEIIFTPMKPPDFDKNDVKIVNLPPVFSRPAGENFIYSCIMFFLLTSWVKKTLFLLRKVGVHIARWTILSLFSTATNRVRIRSPLSTMVVCSQKGIVVVHLERSMGFLQVYWLPSTSMTSNAQHVTSQPTGGVFSNMFNLVVVET